MKETVYLPESVLAHPRRVFRAMVSDLVASRHLARRLLGRNIRVLYRRSFLGAAWAFIPAAATAAIVTFANRAEILSVGETDLPYAAYVVFSMTLWQAFLDGLNGPVQGLAAESRLMAKFSVAPEPIVLAKIGEAFFNFAIRSLLTAVLFLWYQMPLAWTAVFAVAGVAALVALGAAIGLALAPLNTLYEDIAKGLPIATGFVFFLTPVIYPKPETGLFAFLVRLNPITPLLVTTRELTTGQPLTSLAAFLVAVAAAGLFLLAGWVVYRVAMPIVIERARM